jgi:Antirestriction protein (ArdA).
MEMRVYIVNPMGESDGEKKGAWFNLPITWEDIVEKIGLDFLKDEYSIEDYEAPYRIKAYDSIEQLNKYYRMIEEMKPCVVNNLTRIMDEWFEDVEAVYRNKDKLEFYKNFSSMRDLAVYLVNKDIRFGKIDDMIRNCINYEELGRDLKRIGDFLVCDGGILELDY